MPAGVAVVPRPSAWALVSDGTGRIAVVRTPQGVFLPGGGLEPGEDAAAAVVREAREECGLDIVPGEEVGRADEVVHAAAEGTWFEKRGSFLAATVAAHGVAPGEADHALAWLAPAEAAATLAHASHRWAVERWMERAAGTR